MGVRWRDQATGEGKECYYRPPRMIPDLDPDHSIIVELNLSSSDEDSTPDFEEDGFNAVGVDMDGDDANEEFDPCVSLLTRLFTLVLIPM